MVLMPARWATSGVANATSSPPKRTVPASRAYAPVSTLISVDLPAPFCPMRACTSAGAITSRAWRKAGTPPKALSTPCISSSGADATSAVMVRDVMRSVPVGHVRLGVGLVVELVLDLHPGRDLLALDVLLGRLAAHRAEEGAGLHRGAHLAGGDGGQRVAGAVDGDDGHVLSGLLAGRLERGDRADGHLVVVRVDRGDVGMRLQQGLHHLASLVAREV